MKIQVEASEMLGVLTRSGIDSNDAKAIILDLILAMESGRKKPQVGVMPSGGHAGGQKAVVFGDAIFEPSTAAAPPKPEDDAEEDSEGEETRPVSTQRSQVRTVASRLEFGSSFFGGPAEPLK